MYKTIITIIALTAMLIIAGCAAPLEKIPTTTVPEDTTTTTLAEQTGVDTVDQINDALSEGDKLNEDLSDEEFDDLMSDLDALNDI